jgi:hypothetical protein
MLNLQEKAHFSIDEFRRGKGAPLSRHPTSPTTPDGNDDELSLLGGQTRLVSKKEPSSPILERSPISQNPIVPLPLSPGMQNQLQPSVLEYLKSFAPSQNGQQIYPVQSTSSQGSYASNNNSSSHSPYSDDVSPVSIFGMSTMSTPYQPEPSSYLPQQSQPSMQSVMQPPPNGMVSQQGTLSQKANGQDFPSYFPVYDYGLPATNYTASHSYGNSESMLMVDTGSASNTSRRVSGSPDSNMQATWLDFVNTMAMQT